jgi:hypothetical protein
MLISKILSCALATVVIGAGPCHGRGQIPPPPPFSGGNAGDWLGSGPIFGFDTPTGPGFNDTPPGGGGNGGSGGGWGGDNHGAGHSGHIWQQSGGIDSMLATDDSTGVPHSPFMGSCGYDSPSGCQPNCTCNFTWSPGEYHENDPVKGWCVLLRFKPFDVAPMCSNVGENCVTVYRFDK